ncbi:MAG: HNH endonuclease [Clostridia bacterium]|nr:HNH endonuclease [Clostridia bacterium]
MFLYKKDSVNYSVFDGEITLNRQAKDYLLSNVFNDDPQNRDVELLIDGNRYNARLMNVQSSDCVQLSYGRQVQDVFKHIFKYANEYYEQKRREARESGLSTRRIPDQTEEYISIEETMEDFVYAVNCFPKDETDLSNRTIDDVFVEECDELSFPEGRSVYKKHAKYERNRLVVNLAKRRFMENNGKLFCEVCGFCFSEKYGSIGDGFIEAHHIIPVSELGDDGRTNIDDIRLVCSNCHRMLHRKRPWITADRLRDVIIR